MTEQRKHQTAESHDHPPHHAGVNPFVRPLMLIAAYSVIEFAGGVWTHSLALLGDAWHMLFDVLALGLAMLAAALAHRQQQFGRIELWVSLINALGMLVVACWIAYEAVERLSHPQPVAGGAVMLIAVVGLLVNIVVARQLHQHDHHAHGHANLNHRAALLHVLGDLLGSLTAVIAGVVIYFTGWTQIDPLLSFVIALLLLAVTIPLLRDIYRGYRVPTACCGHDHHHTHD